MLIAVALAAAAFVAAIIVGRMILRRTTISVIIRKDPDMATIKERLATLEADNAVLKTEVTELTAQVAYHTGALTNVADAENVAALASRIDAVEAEVGTDPAPEVAKTAAVAPVDPAAPLDPATPAG